MTKLVLKATADIVAYSFGAALSFAVSKRLSKEMSS